MLRLFRFLRRLFTADPAEQYLADWIGEIDHKDNGGPQK